MPIYMKASVILNRTLQAQSRAGMSGAPGLARSLFTFKNVLDSVSINNDFNMFQELFWQTILCTVPTPTSSLC